MGPAERILLLTATYMQGAPPPVSSLKKVPHPTAMTSLAAVKDE